MPAAVPLAVAAIPAIAGIAGAKINSNAAKNATRSQENATREAIAYQREQQTASEARRSAAAANWQRRYDDYLEHFYGFRPTGSASGPGAGGPQEFSGNLGVGAPMGGAPGPAPGGGRLSALREGDTVADILGGMRPGAAPAMASGDQPGVGIGSAAPDWSNWDQYLYSGRA